MVDWVDMPLELDVEPPDMLEQAESNAMRAAAVMILNIFYSLRAALDPADGLATSAASFEYATRPRLVCRTTSRLADY